MPSPEQSLRTQPARLPRLAGWFSPYRLFVRPLLFRFDAETIHHYVTSLAKLVWRFRLGRAATRAVYMRKLRPMPVSLAGMDIPFPLGLAAGFDKNAALLPGIENLGFGFVEIGTVTPRPQLGNPRPRLSRIAEKRALLNRMGFNNEGAEIINAHLKRVRDKLRVPVGVNLGKNRDTPNSEAIRDYELLLKTFNLTASYFAINLSSPNTPGLRELQSGAFAEELGHRVRQLRIGQPVFIKLAPEVAHDDLKAIGALCGPGRPFSGLILTNTIGTDLGGLSGFPLKSAAMSLLKIARTLVSADTPIISVGGIETADDVLERLKLGANAVQLYSALVYGGPALPGRILRDLQNRNNSLHY